MVDQQDLATRFRAAATRWSTVSGTYRTWRQQELVTRAFWERHEMDGSTPNRRVVVAAVSTDPDAGQEQPVEHVLRVHAAEGGRRRRAEAVSRTGEQWMPELVVIDEPWFWDRTGDDVQTNHGDPHHSHGGADFVLLLAPTDVPDGFDLSATDESEAVAGRPCDVVIATPKERDPYGNTPESEVFDMTSGGREFRIHVDQETSTLLRVTKLVDGVPAEVGEFLDIVFDEPVDERLFEPLDRDGPTSLG